MKLSIPRSSLRDALKGLDRVVETRVTLPVLHCIRIEADDAVRFSGTKLDQAAVYQADAKIERPGVCVVELNRLKPFTKGSDNSPIVLDARKDTLCVIQSVHGQDIRNTVPSFDPEEWPAMPADLPVAAAPEGFLARLQSLFTFASDDPSRGLINGVYLDCQKSGSHMVATDGRRLTCVDTTLPLTESCVIPRNRLMLTKTLSDPVSIGYSGGWFRIETGPWSVWTRTLEGAFPNWRQVVPAGKPEGVLSVALTDVELLRKVLPTLPGHDERDASAILEVRRGRVAVKGRNAGDKKWSLVDLPDSRSGGPDVMVAVNRTYLLDALNAGFRMFEITSGDTPIVGRSDDALHVLMPMRIVLDEPAGEPVGEPVPAPVSEPKPVEETTMPEKKAREPSALDRLIAAFDATKAKVREANEALAQAAAAIKDALKEDKQRNAEIATVRSGLAKLQAIRV